MLIRPAERPTDDEALWRILKPILRAGETYAMDPAMARDTALRIWTAPPCQAFVAVDDAGAVVGTCYLKPNQGGGGAHVANAGFMTAPQAAGRGIARAMAGHVMEQARARGFLAMQFNCVVATNRRAIALWESLDFHTLARLPMAFRHPTAGLVDALVMHRTL